MENASRKIRFYKIQKYKTESNWHKMHIKRADEQVQLLKQQINYQGTQWLHFVNPRISVI